MEKKIKTIIQLRRDNESNYPSEYIPRLGEVLLIDTPSKGLQAKVGNGLSTFEQLDYYIGDVVIRGYYYNNSFYEELNNILYNFKSLSIPINTITDFCLYPDALLTPSMIKNQDSLHNLLYLKSDVSQDDISSITIKKDGLYFNLRTMLFKLTNIYAIKNCNFTEIENVINKLKSIKEKEELKNISVDLYFLYKRFDKRADRDLYRKEIEVKKFQNNQKRGNEKQKLKSKYEKIINPTSDDTKNYEEQIKKIDELYPKIDVEEELDNVILRKFIRSHTYILYELLEYSKNDFERISKVSSVVLDSIDYEKLSLIVAVTIKELAQKNKDNQTFYKGALNYLKNYIEENEYLVLENYILEKRYCDPFGISNLKKYEISSIVDFLNTSTEDVKSVEKKECSDIDKCNYSFLKYDSLEKSREVLGNYTKLGNNENNDEYAKRILKDKIDFYENLGYTRIRVGVDSFDGYIGFELDNGVVILDKFFDDMKKGKIATDEAIYISTVDEFDKVTKLSKNECMSKIKSEELNVRRVIHIDGWQNRVVERSKELVKNKD